MFTWAEIALLVLKIVNMIMEQVTYNTAFQAGTNAEIAKISAAILAKTQAGKKIMERINALDETEVDKELRDLESGSPGGVQPKSS